jgi:salicylate hydroxylase
LPTAKPTILIAGAGIGGLTAGLALARHGYGVGIYEQAGAMREAGAGVQLGPNATRLLIGLGLGAQLERVVSAAAHKEVRLWSTGQTWKLFDLGEDCIRRFGAPYWMAHRGDLQQVLVQAFEQSAPGSLHVAARIEAAEEDRGRVQIRLTDGRRVEGDALIGADGVHSRVRQILFGPGPAEFTGIMAWRGVVAMDRLSPALRRPVGTNWHGPGSHVVTYPLRRDTLLNFVGVVERGDWRGESWTDAGSTEECAADFARWHPHVREIIANIGTPFKWALLGRPPMRHWSRGRICLLGDACHPTLPFLAQGANMAIEDGVILARALDAEPGDIPAAFQRFERARMARTARVVQGSADNTKRFHNPALADPTQAAAHIEREWQPETVRLRYDWAYEYDAMRVEI